MTGVYAPVVVPRQILRLVDRLAHAWGQQLYVSDDVEAGAVLLQQVPGATDTGSVVSRASRGGKRTRVDRARGASPPPDS